MEGKPASSRTIRQARRAAVERLAPWMPSSRGQLPFPQRVSPHAGLTALLRPESAIVPFSGRQPQFQALRSWCESSAPADLAIIVGAPGVGKTRLLLEFSKMMTTRGWRCVLLPPHAGDISSLVPSPARGHHSTLFVIDDADRQRPDVEALMDSARRLSGEARFRLIVAGRSTGAWWEPMRISVEEKSLSCDHTLAVELRPLHGKDQRVRLLGDALSAFSSRLRVQRPEYATALGKGQDSTLLVLASALLFVWNLKTTELTIADQQDVAGHAVLDHLLAYESSFRAQQASAHGTDIPPDRLLQMMAVASVLQAADDYEPGDLIEHVSNLTGYEISGPRRPIEWLSDFRAPDLLDTSVDRLPVSITEYLMIRALEANSKLAENIATELNTEQAARLLLALARAHWHPGAEIALSNVIGANPEMMIATAFGLGGRSDPLIGKIVAHTLASMPNIPAETLMNFGSKIERRPAALLPASAEVFRRLADTYKNEPVAQARWLNRLTACLIELGQPAEGGRRSSEAVALCRQAATQTTLPDLAASLNNLGSCLSALDRTAEALDAVTEATVLYRQCAKASPDTYLPDLAASLNNLGSRMADSGRVHEAFEAVREASHICRRLASASPDSHLPDLAASLNNLGSRWAEMGRLDEGLEAVLEAVDIRRRLASASPDSHLPDLAASLNNLGSCLSALDRTAEALDAVTEATGLYRQCAEASPDTYLPDLAASLNNLGSCLSALDRTTEAAYTLRQASAAYASLAAGHSSTSLPKLASSFRGLTTQFMMSGYQDAAVTAMEECVSVRRRLALDDPEAYLPSLASTLHALAQLHQRLGRPQGCVQTAREASELYSQLWDEQPQRFTRCLAKSLQTLADGLTAMGSLKEAREPISKAVRLRRDLAAAEPSELPNLAKALDMLGRLLDELDRTDEARTAFKQASDIQRDAMLRESSW
jgi:tetratricopeptide (TPR) repeat protein